MRVSRKEYVTVETEFLSTKKQFENLNQRSEYYNEVTSTSGIQDLEIKYEKLKSESKSLEEIYKAKLRLKAKAKSNIRRPNLNRTKDKGGGYSL